MNTTTIISQLEFPTKFNYYLKMRADQYNSYEDIQYYTIEARVIVVNSDQFWEILDYLKANEFRPSHTKKDYIIFSKSFSVNKT